MHDARDAEDTRLLEAGEYGLLVEGYYGVILDRCAAGVRRGDPVDVTQAESSRQSLPYHRGAQHLPRRS